MFTRKQYMNNEVTHAAYYGQFVDESIKAIVLRYIGTNKLLDSSDEHMNDIPLPEWDSATHAVPSRTKQAMIAAGDQWSMGSGVCLLKQAARQLMNDEKGDK